MSSIFVPNELLESIFSFVHDKTATPTPSSQETFSSLCLVSKRFLPLARSHLYCRPISPTSYVSWSKALSLVSSLSSSLGQLVISLEGVVDFVAAIGTLADPSTSLPFQLRGYTKTFSLYYALLEACRHLVTVELLFNSSKHFTKLLKALEGCQTSLKTVKFANSSRSTTYRITFRLVQSALQRHELRGIRNVLFHNVDHDQGAGIEPSTELALKSVSLVRDRYTITHARSLLPRNPSTLKSFTIALLLYAQSDLNWILNYVSDQLNLLCISQYNYAAIWQPGLEEYYELFYPSLPPPLFSRLASLTRLSLNGFHGPSLDLLDVLSTSSPTLSLLDFEGSKWIPSPSSSSKSILVGNSFVGIFDSDEALLRLVKFKHLTRAHLGYLPTVHRQTYEGLVREMRGKGVEIEWEECTRLPVCPSCGDRH